jgi:hypothetical protein
LPCPGKLRREEQAAVSQTIQVLTADEAVFRFSNAEVFPTKNP